MTLLHQLAEEIIWAPKDHVYYYKHQKNNKTMVLINLSSPLPTIIQSLLTISGYEPHETKQETFEFGMYYTDDPRQFLQVSKTRHIQQLIYMPQADELKVNGALKKSLWHCMQRIGIVDII